MKTIFGVLVTSINIFRHIFRNRDNNFKTEMSLWQKKDQRDIK